MIKEKNQIIQPVGQVNELVVTYRKKRISKRQYRSKYDLANLFLQNWERDMNYCERLYVAYFDNAMKCVGIYQAAKGSGSSATFDIRAILQIALVCNGFRFAVAHNHPSGNLTPSQSDIRTTNLLESKAMYLGLELIDSLILTEDDYVSISN